MTSTKNTKSLYGPFFEATQSLLALDPEVGARVADEYQRQEYGLEMIASENYASPAVMAAQGSVLTNKYAEGYPGKRYYGGCEFVDQIETLAIERAQKLFGAEAANVQPHSGSQANQAVFLSALKPGDRILGMDLSHGGHLTHGSPVNQSGKVFEAHHYGLNPATGFLDYNLIRDIALKIRPKLLIAGYSAYPRVLDFSAFRDIANEVGALLLVDMAHFAGLVAAGIHSSPVGIADYVTSTTHKTLRGPRGGIILTTKNNATEINKAIFPGLQGGPLEHVIAAKAVAFGEALRPEFKLYQEQVVKNARTLGEQLQNEGLSLITGGTDNHLVLLDLSELEVTGKEAEAALDHAGITVNKNAVPNDRRSPFVTSGLRIGTPALTTRGMQTDEMKLIARWIAAIIKAPTDQELIQKTKQQVRELCLEFPLYR